MTLRPIAIARLQSYSYTKQAVLNTQLEIKALESEMKAIRSAGISDSVPSGGVKSLEDKLVSIILKIREMELSYARAKSRAEAVDNALSTLAQQERLILYRLYIAPEKGSLLKLCEEMDCEMASVYRRRNKALDHFTFSLFGCLDTDELHNEGVYL